MTTIDLYFRDADAADECSRHVGVVAFDDLDEIVQEIARWGFEGGGEPSGQFIDRGFEIVWCAS